MPVSNQSALAMLGQRHRMYSWNKEYEPSHSMIARLPDEKTQRRQYHELRNASSASNNSTIPFAMRNLPWYLTFG
jgi:hypothetical protein